MKKIKWCYRIPDYEHSGDLDNAEMFLKEICPAISIIQSYEERDYEAESEYEEDYGELNEYIYQGWVEFYAPESNTEDLKKIDCYRI